MFIPSGYQTSRTTFPKHCLFCSLFSHGFLDPQQSGFFSQLFREPTASEVSSDATAAESHRRVFALNLSRRGGSFASTHHLLLCEPFLRAVRTLCSWISSRLSPCSGPFPSPSSGPLDAPRGPARSPFPIDVCSFFPSVHLHPYTLDSHISPKPGQTFENGTQWASGEK